MGISFSLVKSESLGLSAVIKALLFTSAFALSSVVFAADDEPTPKPTETTEKCEEGKVWDKEKEECIDIKTSQFNDDDIFQTARELAYADRYNDAIELLSMANNADDPRILNYLGFSHRKAGDFDKAMNYYTKAISINPDYLLARSYMGQGLWMQGENLAAIKQLHEIRNRGGESTWAYTALQDAINSPRGSTSSYY